MTRTKFHAIVAKHGGIVRETGERFFAIGVEAPKGKVWNEGGVHELMSEQSHCQPRSVIYEDLAERMALGTEECKDFECEWCDVTTTGVRS